MQSVFFISKIAQISVQLYEKMENPEKKFPAIISFLFDTK